MSLIDDALRRVQDPLAARELPATLPQAPQFPTPAPAPQKKEQPAHSWPLTPASKKPVRIRFLTLAAILLAAAAAFSWITNRIWVKPTPWPESPAKQWQNPVAKKSQTSLPEPQEAVDPAKTYQLTGVVAGVGEPYAVVNGRIVAKGDAIGQAAVVEITESAVTLQLPDKTQIVLKVPR